MAVHSRLRRRSNAGSTGDSKTLPKPHQGGDRMHPELLHDMSTVDLDGLFDNSKLIGNLLVQQSANHEPKYFAFAFRQAIVQTLQLPDLFVLLAQLEVHIDTLRNRVQQSTVLNRFGQIVERTRLDGAHPGTRVVSGRQEDYRPPHLVIQQLFLQRETIYFTHSNIQNCASGLVGVVVAQELKGRVEGAHVVAR